MRGTRSLIPSIIVVGLVLLQTSVAYSWSLDLTGNFSWTHEFYNQTGHNGFFGPYDVDNGVTSQGFSTKVANLNFWNGGQFDTNLVTGSTSGWSYFNVSFDPRIIINSALKMQARFRLGTYGDPWNTNYNTMDAPGLEERFQRRPVYVILAHGGHSCWNADSGKEAMEVRHGPAVRRRRRGYD